MNPHQRRKLDQLEDELKVPRGTLKIDGEREGYVFTRVHGVIVLLTRKSRNPRGGYPPRRKQHRQGRRREDRRGNRLDVFGRCEMPGAFAKFVHVKKRPAEAGPVMSDD
jgi:hypothetical protein